MPAIRPAEDLNGKIIGTARLSGSSHNSASIAIEHLGLDLKRDKITLIQTGVDRDRMVALKNKAIDAGMLPRVATKVMTSKGFHNLIACMGQSCHKTGLTVKKITARQIPRQSTGLPAQRLEPMAIFLGKRTNSR